MAAIITGIIGELGNLLGGTGIGATIARGALGGISAITAADLLNALSHDLGSGNPQAVAQARRVPQYAIVDLHNNKTVRFLTNRKVYSILTHPSRRRKTTTTRIITVPEDERIVRVR